MQIIKLQINKVNLKTTIHKENGSPNTENNNSKDEKQQPQCAQ